MKHSKTGAPLISSEGLHTDLDNIFFFTLSGFYNGPDMVVQLGHHLCGNTRSIQKTPVKLL